MSIVERWNEWRRLNPRIKIVLREADLRGANLSGANLRGANLRGANLSGANINFSAWPLWCGSLGVTVDRRIAVQLLYHLCRIECDDPDIRVMQAGLASLANEFHRVEECGRIEAG